MDVFESKRGVDRQEIIEQGSTIAKSYDYGMISSAVTSIAPALYRTDQWESSACKVVFSGLGADEVFGGYARYKTA